MRVTRTTRAIVLAAVASTALVLSACGGSSTSDSSGGETSSEEVVVEEGSSGSGAGTTAGAMADASFAVTTYLDTMWPIEGNPYADAPAAEGWCASFPTDADGTVAAVAEYLAGEPDIAAADPAAINIAIAEYLENNCYLIEE